MTATTTPLPRTLPQILGEVRMGLCALQAETQTLFELLDKITAALEPFRQAQELLQNGVLADPRPEPAPVPAGPGLPPARRRRAKRVAHSKNGVGVKQKVLARLGRWQTVEGLRKGARLENNRQVYNVLMAPGVKGRLQKRGKRGEREYRLKGGSR